MPFIQQLASETVQYHLLATLAAGLLSRMLAHVKLLSTLQGIAQQQPLLRVLLVYYKRTCPTHQAQRYS